MDQLNFIGDIVLEILVEDWTRRDVNKFLEELLVAEEGRRWIRAIVDPRRAHPCIKLFKLQRVVYRPDKN